MNIQMNRDDFIIYWKDLTKQHGISIWKSYFHLLCENYMEHFDIWFDVNTCAFTDHDIWLLKNYCQNKRDIWGEAYLKYKLIKGIK